MLHRIRYRVLAVVGIATALGLVATAAFYARHQEQAVLAQNERTIRKLTDSVIQGLQSVMLAGSADIAQAFADRLKRVPGVSAFNIMRVDGSEAFRDNKTIHEVNDRRGEESFLARETEAVVPVMPADDPALRQAIATGEPVALYSRDAHGNRVLSFIAPMPNGTACYKCHGRAAPVRGAIRLTTSLAPVERDILRVRQESLLILALALMGTMLLTGYMLGRIVVRPIERVTDAMARVSGGDLDYKVAVRGGDELGRMATSFNQMTDELKSTYRGLEREQDKLTTIIESATEGMVVTDAGGRVVLTNPAATLLLGKSAADIVAGGFMNLVDDAAVLQRCLDGAAPVETRHQERVLQLLASVIKAADGHVIGSVALIRDISEEKRMEEELRRLSTTDALTGLYNRRFLDATLETEFQRAQRTHARLAVVMFDIDHFKKFNDTHGHDQGDRVLQTVARCLRETLRPFDFPCRYGGEEFVAILPDLAVAEALALAERLRQQVAAAAIDGLHVHISIGVACLPALAAATPAALLEAADAALYRAKEGGRNRVVAAAGMPT